VSPIRREDPRAKVAHLQRVRAKIQEAILVFFRVKGVGCTFDLVELEEEVSRASNATPGSAARVMRSMLEDGMIGYRLMSRTDSCYRVEDDGRDREASQQGTLFAKAR